MIHSILNLPPSRWKCTAAKAAACSLPRNLEGAAIALELPIKKNMDGRRLILKHCKPKPKWAKWDKAGRVGLEPEKWHDNEFEMWSIYDYCKTDTDVERLLDLKLPDLSPLDQKLWELNQETNLRGAHVDLRAVHKIIKMVNSESLRLQNNLQKITKGYVQTVGQRDKILQWLRLRGLKIDNLRAGTVKELLERKDIYDIHRKVLSIRALASKASNKKYFAFVDRTCEDDSRARDILLFNGANTGRDSGVGIQFHNFPRGTHKDTNSIIENILSEDIDTLKILYGDLFSLFSSCLRGMVTATPGCELSRADYNAIECRVVNWISGNKSVLKNFADGIDQYKIMASRIFDKKIEDITDDERFLGKVATLACAYGMGFKKFLSTCVDSYGIKTMTKDLAKKAVKAYRDSHPKITQAWYNVNHAAILAVKNPGHVYKVHKVKFFVKDKFLWCELPSGRRLAYFKPSIRMRSHIIIDEIDIVRIVNGKKVIKTIEKKVTLPPKESLHYFAVNSQTRKFEMVHTYGGSIIENICQAIAADVLRNGVLNAVNAGYTYLFGVHDELICESKIGKLKLEKFIKCLTTLPKWADGLPVKAEGWTGLRYKK